MIGPQVARALLARWSSRAAGSRALRGAGWTVVGFGGAQVMRLVSNLVMTRLLAPEHFGVMAIVLTVLVGLAMFSDIGLGPALVRSSLLDDERLLNTGWSLQVGRGVLMFIACCLGAVPLARFYGEPSLVQLLPVAGLSPLLAALAPMQVYALQRRMALSVLVRIDLGAQALALVVMVCAGLLFRSIWVLVAGAVVSALAKTAALWWRLPVHQHRLSVCRQHVIELARFGGWVFLSTAFTFAANSAGTLALGKLGTMQTLGVFSIALTLAKVSEQLYQQLAGNVLYPVYADLLASPQVGHRDRIFRIRLAIVGAFVPAMCIAAWWAEPIVQALFDPRYHDAGWILQALLMGLVPSMISSTLPYMMARGNFAVSAGFQGARFVASLCFMAAGHVLAGAEGAILGFAAVPAALYLLDHAIQRAHGLADFRIDAAALLVWGATAALILGTRAYD